MALKDATNAPYTPADRAYDEWQKAAEEVELYVQEREQVFQWLGEAYPSFKADGGEGQPCFCIGPQEGHAMCPCMERASGMSPELETTSFKPDLSKENVGKMLHEDACNQAVNFLVEDFDELNDNQDYIERTKTVYGSTAGGGGENYPFRKVANNPALADPTDEG
jgi:hypothetical protein